MLCMSLRIPTQLWLARELVAAFRKGYRRQSRWQVGCDVGHAAPGERSTHPRDALLAMIAFNFVPKIIVSVADRVLPACFKGRLSPEYDAEQQAGDEGCSDLLSATQRRVSSKDGRRFVAEPCLHRHSIKCRGCMLCRSRLHEDVVHLSPVATHWRFRVVKQGSMLDC